MEEPTQVLRCKIFSRKKPVKTDEQTPSCVNCRYIKSKTCGSKEEHLKCHRPPPIEEPSLASLKDSAKRNCCCCCCNLLEFFKQVFKAISGDPNNRVCDTLGLMTDHLLALMDDCVLFLRRIYKCLIENFTEEL